MKPVTSTMTVCLQADLEKIWAAVTNLQEYSWRSDLSKIEASGDGKTFTEYAKNGFPTVFTITAFEPCRRYAFDMQNASMHGHWDGTFTQTDKGVIAEFTETVTVRGALMRIFAGTYLKNQQKRYFADLQKYLQIQNFS